MSGHLSGQNQTSSGKAAENQVTGANRRDTIKWMAAGATAAFLRQQPARAATARPSRRPNIIYIHSHDSGRYFSPYGHAVPTPNIQKLAREGVLFRNAFCAAPTCSPSRACLLTGEVAHQNGMLGLVNRGFAMTPEGYQHHIIRTLRHEAGYYSALVGLQHIARDPHIIGYDYLDPTVWGSCWAKEVAPAAVRFIKDKARSKEPFWLTVGFMETHRPYPPATVQDDWRYVAPPGPSADAPATRRDMADFHASVRHVDWGVGQVLAALEEAGLADNTLVISTTDHGIAWPDMKCCLYDGGVGVHLVMRGPGLFGGGRVCDAMVSQLDLYPTLCEVLNIPAPAWLHGKSFLPVLRGQANEINDTLFAEVNFHACYEPKRAAWTHRYKFIRRFDGRTTPVLPNCDEGGNLAFWHRYSHLLKRPKGYEVFLRTLYKNKDCGAKDYWLQHGWAQQYVPPEALYDRLLDPNERCNLIADDAHQKVVVEMRHRLDSWMHNTKDPLLDGPVKPPRGAILNYPDQISPLDPKFRVG